MKIKEVKFEKLFSLEKYNNERIGFVAEVEEGEDADKVVAELHFKILDIEDCLQAYRNILSDLDYAVNRFQDEQSCLKDLERRIADMKVRIEEISERLARGDLSVDEKLRHACDRQSYRDMQDQLERHKKALKEWDEKVEQLTKAKVELRERIKNGNFSLEGIEIPVTRPRGLYY